MTFDSVVGPNPDTSRKCVVPLSKTSHAYSSSFFSAMKRDDVSTYVSELLAQYHRKMSSPYFTILLHSARSLALTTNEKGHGLMSLELKQLLARSLRNQKTRYAR